VGGMHGEITLNKPWGDVIVRIIIDTYGDPREDMLFNMMDYDIPVTPQIAAGELKAPGVTIYWRVRPSAKPGHLDVVIARKCERESMFDNWVSFTTTYPGNMAPQVEVGNAIQQVNSLVGCLEQ